MLNYLLRYFIYRFQIWSR